nr:HD domain-containing phosphohydrolase [Terriglobus roseus]
MFQHSLLAGAIASVFARSVSLSTGDELLLVTGALLHDVGKVLIDRLILQKNGPLTSAERIELERHPEFGYRLLKEDGWDPAILELVHLHHERLDGSGYPHRFHAEKIGRLVRMVTLCDVFSALIEERSYRPSPRRPLEIMSVMTSELDGPLFGVFAEGVAELAFSAQRFLKLEMSGALIAN